MYIVPSSYFQHPVVTKKLLVDIESLHLIIRLHQLLIPPLHNKLDNPSHKRRSSRKARTGKHSNTILGSIARVPKIRRPDERGIHNGGDDGNGGGLLFRGLAAGAADPAEDQRVYGVGADGEDDHGEVADAGVVGDGADDEADDCDGFGGGDVPCTFVHLARGPRDQEG